MPSHDELKARVLAALAIAQGCEPDEDDIGMLDENEPASDEHLLDWVDDLEARVGLDVADLRDAMLDFIEGRNPVTDEERANGPRRY